MALKRRFKFLELSEAALPPEADECLDEGLSFLMLPAAPASTRPSDHALALREWKHHCDVLLPALRPRSHLYNLIYRHRANCSLVLKHGDVVVGGATFRLIRDAGGASAGVASSVILEVLLLAVAQQDGVCGRGHGTRLVNGLKAFLLAQAAGEHATPLLLTQSDLGTAAREFWRRQLLRESEEAGEIVQMLHAWHASNIVYDYTVPMLMQPPADGWRCTPRESVRADRMVPNRTGWACGAAAMPRACFIPERAASPSVHPAHCIPHTASRTLDG